VRGSVPAQVVTAQWFAWGEMKRPEAFPSTRGAEQDLSAGAFPGEVSSGSLSPYLSYCPIDLVARTQVWNPPLLFMEKNRNSMFVKPRSVRKADNAETE